ncbi:hypothetical protein V6K52_03730 [Knoellia sp. S7-12]|uniref:hypothetical protein n=1 Tax=Knoellia sp. S7-12 TaxID=3126698 RepID=UPI003365FCBA
MLEYALIDYDPVTDGDEADWARTLDAHGWRTWHDTGVWVTVNGRRVRRWSVRRRSARGRAT